MQSKNVELRYLQPAAAAVVTVAVYSSEKHRRDDLAHIKLHFEGKEKKKTLNSLPFGTEKTDSSRMSLARKLTRPCTRSATAKQCAHSKEKKNKRKTLFLLKKTKLETSLPSP